MKRWSINKLTVIAIGTVLLLSILLLGCAVYESRTDMFDVLNGMWLIEDGAEQEAYYIFKDEQVYYLHESAFEFKMDEHMDAVLENSGLEELCKLDYQTVLDSAAADEILGDPVSAVIDYKKGKIIFDKGKSYEKQIVVEENSAVIKKPDSGQTTSLRKVSDTLDFSGESFARMFAEAKESYMVSTADFWRSPKSYGEMVYWNRSEAQSWDKTTETETTTIYEPSKWQTNTSGCLAITENSVDYVYKLTLSSDWNPQFVISYRPDDGELIVMDIDNGWLDMHTLFYFVTNAISDFPGMDYAEPIDLFKEINTEKSTLSSGVRTVEKKINGISFKLQTGTDGTMAMLWVQADSSISLAEIMETASYKPDNKVCSQCGVSEPDVSFSNEGTLCDGCNYDNNHGMQKVVCSQCGEDCTYRGVEADGRCEDCHNSSATGGGTSGQTSPGSGTSGGSTSGNNSGNTSGGSGGNTGGSVSSGSGASGGQLSAGSGSSSGQTSSGGGTSGDSTSVNNGGNTSGGSGNTDNGATACTHSYAAATCTEPRTCTLCGVTSGTAKGHSWTDITQMVEHEEKGHYEEVRVTQKVYQYKCVMCGFKNEDLQAYFAHFDSTHSGEPFSNHFREDYATVSDYVYTYETQWVVDEPAYTEEIVIGRKCSTCEEQE